MVFFRWTAQTGTYLEPNRAAFRVPVARTKPGYLSTILSRMSIQYSVAYIGVVHPNLVGALEHVLFSISHIYIYMGCHPSKVLAQYSPSTVLGFVVLLLFAIA